VDRAQPYVESAARGADRARRPDMRFTRNFKNTVFFLVFFCFFKVWTGWAVRDHYASALDNARRDTEVGNKHVAYCTRDNSPGVLHAVVLEQTDADLGFRRIVALYYC
jgi:hypothetical protein